MNVKELKVKAKELGLKGYSNLNKAELEALITKKENERMAQSLGAEVSDNTTGSNKSNKGGNMKKKQAHMEADAKLKHEMAKLAGEVGMAASVVGPFPTSEEVMEEIKAEIKKLPKVVYKYTPTKMETVEGRRINPCTEDGIVSCTITKENFKIATGNPWYTAVSEGRVVPYLLEYNADTDIKKQVVKAAMRRVYKGSLAKEGVHRFLFGKTADQSKSVFYSVTREELVNIIGTDPSIKKPVNKIGMPTFSNNILELMTSDIEDIRLRVVDPRIKSLGRNPNDGACYIDSIKFYYEEYISEKDKAEGKKAKLKVLDEGQMRLSGWKTENEAYPVIKDDSWLPTFFGYAEKFCTKHGLELGDCHGAIDIESLKSNPNGLKHGDVLVIAVKDIRWANKVSEDGSNRIGTQGQCCDPKFTQAILEEARPAFGVDKMGMLIEPGIRAKGEMFKEALSFKASAIGRVIRATASMEDSPLQEIKCLSFAIPKDKRGEYAPLDPNAEWFAPKYQSIFNQLCARLWAAYTNDILRARVGNCSVHFLPDPTGLVDELEQKIYDETGEIVSLCIVPNNKDFLVDYHAHKYLSGGRAPFVGPASESGLLAIRTDENGEYITDLERLRKREGKLVTTTKSGIIVSSLGILLKDGTWVTSCIESFNGDFDGDGAIVIFSNETEAPVYRIPKEMPGVEEGDKPKPEPMGDDEFLAALGEAYSSQIESQKAIGMMDNFRKLLYAVRRAMNGKVVEINGVNRVCKPIPASIGHIIAAACEEMIQGKKHVITADSVTKIKAQLAKKYAPNGELPAGDDRPIQYMLLHNSLGLTESDEVHINHEVLLNHLCYLINEYNKRGIDPLDCYQELWKAMKGATIELCHDDSEYWRDSFVQLWDKLQTIFPRKVSDTTIQRCISMGDFLNGNGSLDMMDRDPDTKALLDDPFTVWKTNEKKFPGYRWLSKAYNDIKDNEVRQEKYSELFQIMETYIKQWLENVCGVDLERKMVMLKILAIYLGQMGFGVGVSQRNQQVYSLPGHAFWVLGSVALTDKGFEGKTALRWVAKQIHPNNPYLKDLK